MRGWIDTDEHGVSYAVRMGTGTVTAVAEGTPDSDQPGLTMVVVEIDCTQRGRRPRSIRVTTRGWLNSDDPLVALARHAETDGVRVTWLIEWHRRSHVPDSIPIEHLNSATDTVGLIKALAPLANSALAELEEAVFAEDVAP